MTLPPYQNDHLRPEYYIVSAWRQGGVLASSDARANVHLREWCHRKLIGHGVTPISLGDLGLIMEYAPDLHIRQAAAQMVIRSHAEKTHQ